MVTLATALLLWVQFQKAPSERYDEFKDFTMFTTGSNGLRGGNTSFFYEIGFIAPGRDWPASMPEKLSVGFSFLNAIPQQESRPNSDFYRWANARDMVFLADGERIATTGVFKAFPLPERVRQQKELTGQRGFYEYLKGDIPTTALVKIVKAKKLQVLMGDHRDEIVGKARVPISQLLDAFRSRYPDAPELKD